MADLSPRALLQTFHLPQRLRVAKGYFGKREEDALGEGDEITAFYARREMIVVATDRNGHRVTLPFKSPMLFWILVGSPKHGHHHSDGDDEDPVVDYSASYTLDDLVRRFPLPVCVRAQSHEVLSASVAWQLTVAAVEPADTIYAGTSQMDELIAIPVDLDVAFDVLPTAIGGAHKGHAAGDYSLVENPFFESLLEANEIREVGPWSHRPASLRAKRKSVTVPRASQDLPDFAAARMLFPPEALVD
eukprot:m.112001 g.112001  ORF g.112001 m.112001 type:complete len:246 (-) comp9101_c0_seq5:315-1052(-)